MNSFVHTPVSQNPGATAPGSPAVHPLVPRAADMKAAGASWDAVAAELELDAEEVREWPRVYRGQWKAEYAFAAEQVAGECVAESLHTLRRHLRDAESKTSLAAAALLARLQMTETRHRGTEKPAAAADDDPLAGVNPEAYHNAFQLQNMTHDERETMIDEYVERRKRRKAWPAEDEIQRAKYQVEMSTPAGTSADPGGSPDAPDDPGGGGISALTPPPGEGIPRNSGEFLYGGLPCFARPDG